MKTDMNKVKNLPAFTTAATATHRQMVRLASLDKSKFSVTPEASNAMNSSVRYSLLLSLVTDTPLSPTNPFKTCLTSPHSSS